MSRFAASGVCTCGARECASVASESLQIQARKPAFLRRYKDTTFAVTGLTILSDTMRFLDFIFKKLRPSYILLLTSSWFSQLLHDSADLSGRECLAVGFVACRLQLFPKLGAAANPVHQVTDCRARTAVGKIHQRQFLLCVCSNNKLIHTSIFQFFNSSTLHNNLRSLYCRVATDNAPCLAASLSVAGRAVRRGHRCRDTCRIELTIEN